MYDVTRRAQFSTVGDLKKLLHSLSDSTKVFVCGAAPWLHIEEDDSAICFDSEPLLDDYFEV